MTHLLLPAECEELATLSLRVLQRAEQDALLTDPHALIDVVDAIAGVVRTALAVHLRSYNFSLLPQRRLPTELWPAVWINLSQKDCIAVSHVCHDWRTAVLAHAQLWTKVEFASTVHTPKCSCLTCRLRKRPCGTCHRLPVPPMDTFERTWTTVERSAGLLLELSVAIDAPDFTGLPRWTDLSQLVRLHAHRIRSLDLKMRDMFACGALIHLFDSSTALKVLTVRDGQAGSDAHADVSLQATATILQNLQTLRILASITYERSAIPLCSKAHEVEASFSSASDIYALLLVAPCVQTLRLRYERHHQFLPPQPSLQRDIRTSMHQAATRRLYISHVPSWTLPSVLSIFDLTALDHVEVNGDNALNLEEETFTNLLSSLSEGAEQLEWLVEPVGCFSARSADEHSRTITFASESPTHISIMQAFDVSFVQDPRETVRRLHLDFSMWPAIFRPAQASRVWNIRELIIDAYSTVGSLLDWAELAILPPGAIPFLEKLHLRAAKWVSPLETLVRAWGNMGLEASGQRLKMLLLEGLEVDTSELTLILPVDEVVGMPFQRR